MTRPNASVLPQSRKRMTLVSEVGSATLMGNSWAMLLSAG